jgi:hypothetical protein
MGRNPPLRACGPRLHTRAVPMSLILILSQTALLVWMASNSSASPGAHPARLAAMAARLRSDCLEN